jgi:methyltransferase (TIGR00027 family)
VLSLRPLERGDLPVLGEWLAAPHVYPWWLEASDPESVAREYAPGNRDAQRWIIELDGESLGMIQRYRLADSPEWERAVKVAGGAGIDYLIGDATKVGKGVGSVAIRMFTQQIFADWPDVYTVVAVPQQANRASWRALDKAGYERLWGGQLDSDDPADAGPAYVYVCHRTASTAPLSALSKTALGAAFVRAEAGIDPYAAAFLEAVPDAFAGEGGDDASVVAAAFDALREHLLARTRFFDDFVATASAAGCLQVVLLAAGLDTRAYRLDWPPGTRLYEVDLPAVLEFKEQVLAAKGAVPRCCRTPVAADLRGPWPARLNNRGFDANAPTAWLAEGLLMYLTAAEARQLVRGVGALSAPGSQWSLDHGQVADASRLGGAIEDITALWTDGSDEQLPGWLTEDGWRITAQARRLLSAVRRG